MLPPLPAHSDTEHSKLCACVWYREAWTGQYIEPAAVITMSRQVVDPFMFACARNTFFMATAASNFDYYSTNNRTKSCLPSTGQIDILECRPLDVDDSLCPHGHLQYHLHGGVQFARRHEHHEKVLQQWVCVEFIEKIDDSIGAQCCAANHDVLLRLSSVSTNPKKEVNMSLEHLVDQVGAYL